MKNITNKITIVLLIGILILLSGCSPSKIEDIKKEEFVGKSVKVSGKVDSGTKIGSLSGYALKDDTGRITISSGTIPKEGTEITVSGTLMKNTIFGYYIKTNK